MMVVMKENPRKKRNQLLKQKIMTARWKTWRLKRNALTKKVNIKLKGPFWGIFIFVKLFYPHFVA